MIDFHIQIRCDGSDLAGRPCRAFFRRNIGLPFEAEAIRHRIVPALDATISLANEGPHGWRISWGHALCPDCIRAGRAKANFPHA